MHRGLKFVSLICVLALFSVARPSVAGMQELLNASSWDLEYDVTFKAAAERSDNHDGNILLHTISLESTFSGYVPLNFRNGGANLNMVKLTRDMSGAHAQSPELQQKVMAIVMRTDELANWMYAAPGMLEDLPEPATAPEADSDSSGREAGKGTAQLDFTWVVTGKNLNDEHGGKYDYISTTTRKGSGKITISTGSVFELDATGKSYMVTLGHEFADETGSLAKYVTVERTTPVGSEPIETTDAREESLHFPNRIVIDDSTLLLGQILFLEGAVDPAAGSVIGERTVKAHFDHVSWTIPGTLHVRYKLTPK